MAVVLEDVGISMSEYIQVIGHFQKLQNWNI